MTKGISKEIASVIVTGSHSVARPDGRFAIVLETLQNGAIAFEVDQQAIQTLRREPDAIEALMKTTPGNA